MATTLNSILSDCRLARLFSSEERPCALQLWVLQIKFNQSTENRIVYGRLLPYSHADNNWHFSDHEKFHSLEKAKARVIRLNLYIKSADCAELLKQLNAGNTISEISDALKFKCSERLRKNFGSTALEANNLIYRTVAYLLNRDAHDWQSLTSPHSMAGALSASITRVDKGELFRLNEEYDVSLAKLVVECLNKETGLDFGGTDTTRLGDLELLVFPTLNDAEHNLLRVEWASSPYALSVRFNPMQVPHFNRFQFHLKITNDGKVVYSTIISANRDELGEVEGLFQLSHELKEITDSTELEIFGFKNDDSDKGMLCCWRRINYVREINLQVNLVGQNISPVKFDWLEKTTKPAMQSRVTSALTINSSNQGSISNHIGNRTMDPWIPVNKEILSLFARLHPPKSEGRFFQRWSMGNGEGRLQFVEWFKTLLGKYKQYQIVVFDPYFDGAGLGLLLLCSEFKPDCIVFTSLPKQSKKDEDTKGEFTQRVNNLMASCERNSHLLENIKLRIYGLKEGRLHDRYILIMGSDGLPVAGFHLSNSFQTTAENYPLLVTPIPADILLQVERYKDTLIREAMTKPLDSEQKNPAIQLLFDSSQSPVVAQSYEPLHFLEKSEAGNALSIWSGEPSLKGLYGEQLRKQMAALGLLRDDSLVLLNGLESYINKQVMNFQDFVKTWEILGDLIAHSSTDYRSILNLPFKHDFLKDLCQFLNESFDRPHNNMDKKSIVPDVRLFRESVEFFLHNSHRIEGMFHLTKYTALSWSEYFAIKILWSTAPNSLLMITEEQSSDLLTELNEKQVVRLSLLGQIISEISLSVQFDISEIQLNRLVSSNQGLLQWMGLNALERQLDTQDGFTSVLLLLESFPDKKRVQALGWMVYKTATDSKKKEINNRLIMELHKALPKKISMEELRHLIDSMRGHMRQLARTELWLFKDVIAPLLESGRIATEDACNIWIQELGQQLKDPSCLFYQKHEGQMTNIAAFLFAYSSPRRQEDSLKMMMDILKSQKRIVQQPLASTSDWYRWDAALKVSLWILTFGKWSELYLRQNNSIPNHDLEELLRESHELAMVRPIEEWRGIHDELIAFLEQIEQRLNTDDGQLGELAD